jgi:hypothetical protein
LSFDLRLLITHLVSSNFALIIILSVLLWFTASDYPFSFFKLCFGHCIVCPSLIYGLWLHIWYLQTLFWSLYCLSFFDLRLLITHLVSSNFVLVIVLSVLLWFTASDYTFDISKLCFGHCIVCPSSIYGFWLPIWNTKYIQVFLIYPGAYNKNNCSLLLDYVKLYAKYRRVR